MPRESGGRHAALVAAGILVSRVLGFVRERVFAHYFGNDTIPADAFRIALRIPNTIRNLLGEGTLSASFIPVYAALNEREDKSAARAVAGAVLGPRAARHRFPRGAGDRLRSGHHGGHRRRLRRAAQGADRHAGSHPVPHDPD